MFKFVFDVTILIGNIILMYLTLRMIYNKKIVNKSIDIKWGLCCRRCKASLGENLQKDFYRKHYKSTPSELGKVYDLKYCITCNRETKLRKLGLQSIFSGDFLQEKKFIFLLKKMILITLILTIASLFLVLTPVKLKLFNLSVTSILSFCLFILNLLSLLSSKSFTTRASQPK